MSETTPIPVIDTSTEGLDPVEQAALVEAQRLQELEKSLHVEVLDVSKTAVEAKAIDHGDAYIAEQTSQRGFKGLMKRVWYGNIAHDYIRQREIQRGRSTIVEEENSFALTGGTKAQHDAAMGAVVTGITKGFLSEGESSRELDDSEPSQNLRTGIQALVRGFADGSVSTEALEEQKTRLLSDYGRTLTAEDRNKGLLFATNITEVAIAAKAAVTHGLALDKLDQLLSINSGEARTGVRTEARQTATDKIVNKLYSTKAGAMVNETTLALAVGTVMTIAKFTTRKAATAAGAFVTLGAGAGLIAGARAHAKYGQERQLHLRERATGGEMPATGSAKRREKIEETRYDTVRSSDLHDRLEQARAAVNEADPVTIQALLESVTETATRIRLSDEESKDLIQYDSETSVEHERLALAIQLAEAKVQLMRSGVSAATISERAGSVAELLRSDISDKDRVFAKQQRQETMKMAALGFVSGMVIGDVLQEVKAAFSDDLQGVFEGDSSDQDRRTLLAGIFSSHHHAAANHIATVGHETAINKDLSVGLPPDYHMQGTTGGHYELVGPNNKPLVGNIVLDSHGQIDPASLNALHNAGVDINSHNEAYTTSHTVFEKSTRTPAEYIHAHPDHFTNIHREIWYDNDTTVFDKNELRLDWGGQGGSGMDAHGNYQFDVKSMFPAGSFHEGAHTDAQQLLSSGKMAIALSMDKATQAHVMMMHVDANGIATIKADSWEARSLFENRNGQAHFVGGYAEAVQLMGHNPNGGESVRMLATIVGDNHPKSAVDTISHIVTSQHERTIMDMNVAEKGELPIEIPFPIPLYARRGLESLKRKPELSNPDLSPMYYGGKSLAELRAWIAEDPRRLRTRSEVIGDDGVSRWLEVDGAAVERSVEREKLELTKYIDSERSSNAEHMRIADVIASAMKPMEENCRVAINVPAWMEEKNIEHFLDQYASQLDSTGSVLDANLYEINVLVNRKTGSIPDGTVGAIQRFISNFEQASGYTPPVNYADVEIDEPYNNVGYARKLLTDAVVLRSLSRPTQTGPLYFETEDADMLRVDRKTVSNLISKLDSHPELDAVRGVQDRSPEYMKENDMLFIRRRAADFFELLAGSKSYREPKRSNWNFTWNRVVTGGWNTGYSAEAYGLIGGYDPVKTGEDMSIGEKITMVRGDGNLPNLEVVGKVSTRSDSSPRRFIHEILTDKGAYADDNFSDEAINQTIRDSSLKDALESISVYSRIDDSNQAAFTGFLQWQVGNIRNVTSSEAEAQQFAKRLMFWLGFKHDDYRINGDNLSIESWDNVKGKLNGYRSRYDSRLGRATLSTA